MRTQRTVAISLICALGMAGTATAQTIYDNTDDWVGDISNEWASIAQTFAVPADNHLATWETVVFSGNNGNFRIIVHEWDSIGNHAVGPQLFDSGFMPAPSTPTFIEFNIGLDMTPGVDHAVIFQWDNDGVNSGVGFLGSAGGQSFPFGYQTFTVGPITDPWAFTAQDNWDMPFRAVFLPALPAPGALALLGLAGCAAGRRRRTS